MKWLKQIIYNLDAVVTGGALIATTALVLVNVFMRYFLNAPLIWSEEVATTCFVWSIFMGGAVTFRNRAHLGVDIVVKWLPDRISKAVQLLNSIIVILILAILTYTSYSYMVNSMSKKSNVLQFSYLWYTIPVVIGFGMSLLWAVFFLIRDVRAQAQPEIGKEGGS